jgi:hypothetical protein
MTHQTRKRLSSLAFKATHPLWFLGDWLSWKAASRPGHYPNSLDTLGLALKHLSWSFTHLNHWRPAFALSSLLQAARNLKYLASFRR